ncbi:acyl carrier protein [Carboxylicivirga taeanensis]|uniref:acyl carrier protein n=1 Tax=Carboxylicivirga taeanensis TaxID=1416875 RepID=UPI003F6DB358
MKEKIKEFIGEITFMDTSSLGDELMLFEEGVFDSMGLLSLITFLDEEWGVKIDDTDLSEENFQSVNAIVAFLERKLVSQS